MTLEEIDLEWLVKEVKSRMAFPTSFLPEEFINIASYHLDPIDAIKAFDLLLDLGTITKNNEVYIEAYAFSV